MKVVNKRQRVSDSSHTIILNREKNTTQQLRGFFNSASFESYILTFAFGKNHSTLGQEWELVKYSLHNMTRRMKGDGEEVSPLGSQAGEDEVVAMAGKMEGTSFCD